MKPIVGVTMGDPAGVGPEIIAKALIDKGILELCRPVVFGSCAVMEEAFRICGLNVDINVLDEESFAYKNGAVNILDIDNVDIESLNRGKVSGDCGKAAYQYVEKAVELAIDGRIKAIATAPVNKESLRAANVPFIGHTEMLEKLTGVTNPLTMFQVDSLRIFFLTRHVSLRKACDLVTEMKLYEMIKRSFAALKRLGVKDPVIAVAALNPHGGEHGLFGDEEENEIRPAIKRAADEGYNVVGPFPADSVFHFAATGKYDAVVSLYHDQGHIAAKMMNFEKTVSITNNLPFLRTSVDHGTAFDIAGTGIASEISMIEAIRLAGVYSRFFI
ncbi:4-hydroxythreonine-4-phosphate dehydrogenase PdxA [Gudongella sp. DL1XJH-153]|uniref:4-hydroxythreonine-4-phosphate dehydrogenase PdxA n=1 Tax=Gudongella sp. DL1XJH-153 TaxID=3409804 RepID=UPI003BB5CBAD